MLPWNHFPHLVTPLCGIQGVRVLEICDSAEFKGSEYLKFATVVQEISVCGISSTLTP